MKCTEFKILIERISRLGKAVGVTSEQDYLSKIAPLFDLWPTKNVADLSKRLDALSAVSEGPTPTVGLVLVTLDAAGPLFEDFGKPAAAKDLKAFATQKFRR
jgi:hypothetical protein